MVFDTNQMQNKAGTVFSSALATEVRGGSALCTSPEGVGEWKLLWAPAISPWLIPDRWSDICRSEAVCVPIGVLWMVSVCVCKVQVGF